MASGGSGTTEEGEPTRPTGRTVTPRYRSRPDAEMTTIGYIYFAILIVVLLPLLPFLAIIWAIGRLMEPRGRSEEPETEEHEAEEPEAEVPP